MSITTNIKNAINTAMRPVNLKLDTLTAEKVEADRVQRQIVMGQFEKPAYPLLEGMRTFDGARLAAIFAACRTDLDRLLRGSPPGRFDRANTFYNTPDAEILYLIVRSLAPKRIVEVGSGNSTRIIRQAIADGRLIVSHIAIDPEPRADITGLTDRVLRQRFEETDVMEELYALEADDILFIDSSHEVRVANDVTKLFCNAIPALAKGVVVHVHDVFLPFDYPQPFCVDYPCWGEQYLLQVMLAARPCEILWPGYYLQKIRPELCQALPFLATGRAQSFWFRT
jgi:Methyltransferase domain